MKWFRIIIFALHILVGTYLINFSFDFYSIPDFITDFNELIILFGGVLILFGGLNFLRTLKPRKR